MADLTNRSTYKCETCRRPCEATVGSLLSMLQLCAECQEKRSAKGLAEQRRALAQEKNK